MPITKRGVYHNLKESKYVVSNSDITFFFSSEHTLNKFMNGHQKHREDFSQNKIKIDAPFNWDTLADIVWYQLTEKRGFYVWLKNVSIDKYELHQYARRKMSDKDSPNWQRIQRVSPALRIQQWSDSIGR